jgi:hypothetical protein
LTVMVVLFDADGSLTEAAVNCAVPVAVGVNVKEADVGALPGQAAPVQLQVTPLFEASLVTVAAMVTD